MNESVIAITGGTGFVGQSVMDVLAAQGVFVRALARTIPTGERKNVRWVQGDLANTAALNQLVEGAGTVLHIAGAVNAPDLAAFQLANVAGTENMIEAVQAAGAARFIFVSSLSAREPGLSAYGRSKRYAEEVVQTSQLDWTIVRPPAIYGPRDREIFELFRAARMGVVPMPPAGRASMIHVHDLARLLVALCRPTASLLEAGGESVSQRIFEPDDGREGGWSHRELAQGIGAALGRKVWVPHLPKPLLSAAARIDRLMRGSKAKLTPDRVGYMSHPDWTSDPNKAPPEELWQPQIGTLEGLRSTAEWYRQAGWL